MNLFAVFLLAASAPAATPEPTLAGTTRTIAMASVEILSAGRSGLARSDHEPARAVRRESGATITVFE